MTTAPHTTTYADLQAALARVQAGTGTDAAKASLSNSLIAAYYAAN